MINFSVFFYTQSVWGWDSDPVWGVGGDGEQVMRNIIATVVPAEPELPRITSTSIEAGSGDLLVTFLPGSTNYVLKSSDDLNSSFEETESATLENGNSTFRVPAADLNPGRDFFVIEFAQ